MADPTPPPSRQVKVWDVPTRVFHWALVLLVLLSYLTGEIGGFDFIPPWSEAMVANMTVHMWSGLTILALVLARVIWGFVGSSTSRFSNFAAGPGAIVAYVGSVAKRAVKFTAGHNPAGGLMVIVMLILLLVQGGLGLFAKEDDFFGVAGPLNGLVDEDTAKQITGLHHDNWEIIEILVLIHIAANALYWVVLKQNLIVAMFTGRKDLPAGASATDARMASPVLAVAVLAISAAIVWGITKLG
ncbi:MAG: cytochrome b/b6 domain-containing protein [Rhodospirillaceae bacterium]|nr:cytochrome b/b6 domain-containing protein [Rhodospirillaceae bacterium]